MACLARLRAEHAAVLLLHSGDPITGTCQPACTAPGPARYDHPYRKLPMRAQGRGKRMQIARRTCTAGECSLGEGTLVASAG